MSEEERRTTCPNCQGDLAYAASYEGQTLICPHGCGASVLLVSTPQQVDEPQATSNCRCQNCHGEVQYPAISEGQRIPCPHGCGAYVLLSTAPQPQLQDRFEPVVVEEKEEESDWTMGIGIFVVVIVILVAKDQFFGNSSSPAPNDASFPNTVNPAESTGAPKVINKTERLDELRAKLIGKTPERVVAIMGKPDRVLNGGNDLFYSINEEDSVTGAIYKHIQVSMRDAGFCDRVSIGVTEM